MKQRIFALVLAILFVLPAVAGCSQTGGETPESSSGTADSVTLAPPTDTAEPEETKDDPLAQRRAEADNLPEADFEGRDFVVFGTDDDDYGKYVTVEDQTGERVNDAVFDRNLAVEERFHARIVRSTVPSYDDGPRAIFNAVDSGDNAYDLICYQVVSSGGNALEECYLNWYDIPHVDFSRPWWSASNVEDLTINGRCFLAMGDFALSTVGRTYVMIYDRDEANNYQLGNYFYDTVKEGRWTLDALGTVCRQVYTDKDGDGKANDADYYGLGTDTRSNLNTYFWSTGNMIFSRGDDGELEYDYMTEHLVDVYNKCWSLIHETAGVWTSEVHRDGMLRFSEYGCLLCNAYLDGTIIYLADFNHDYGVIPYPKYDEEQAEYKTMVDGNHEALAVLISEPDLEFVGIMTEALCAESYKQVMPVFFDVCLKQRYASSPEDTEMMDLCVASRVFDFGYVYDYWQGVAFWFDGLLADASHPDIASYFAMRGERAEKHYDAVLELFWGNY